MDSQEFSLLGNMAVNRNEEALFYLGYAYLKLNMIQEAKKQWDLLYKESPRSIYGMLAERELEMLSWRNLIQPKLLQKIKP
jgi:outer membrane protein assembly factor BamD (BamD/ComL family)